VKGALVVVDSSALLTAREIAGLPIRVVQLGVTRGETADTLGDDVAAEEGNRSPDAAAPPRTNAVQPGEYIDTFSSAVEAGYSSLVLTLAAAISSTHQSATVAERTASELLNQRGLGYLKVRIVDSGQAVGGLALLALAAGRCADGDCDSVAQSIKRVIPRVVTYGMLAEWDALWRGGRIPVGAIWAARHMGIYPTFRLSRGSLRPWRLPRSQESGLRSMLSAVSRLRGAGRLHIAVFGDDAAAIASFAERFEPMAPTDLLTLRTNDLVAAHTGRGVIGVSAYREP
jgi:DegV family protein with EDD domain